MSPRDTRFTHAHIGVKVMKNACISARAAEMHAFFITRSCRCTLNRSCFYSPIKNNKLMATTPHLQLNGLWLLWRTGSACRRPLLISLPSKGKLNNVGQMLQPSHPTQAGTQTHTTLPPPSLQIKKQKSLYVLRGQQHGCNTQTMLCFCGHQMS